MTESQVIVLGSGAAGLTAAIYLSRYNYQPLVLAGEVYGGKPTWTDKVENYPGFVEGIAGVQLSQNMIAQAEKLGAQILMEGVKKVDLSQRPFKLWTSSPVEEQPDYLAQALIIATGCKPVMLGLEEEKSYLGRGLALCATCDGPFYKNKVVAVVGGGNSAVQEAHLLSQYARKVILIHRRANWRADKVLVSRLSQLDNLEIIMESEVIGLLGEKYLENIRIKNVINGEEKIILADGVFLALGTKPETEFLRGQLELNEKGYIKRMIQINENRAQTATNVAGVFVAGDVADERYKQIAVAVGQGAMAGIDAVRFLDQL